MIEIERKFLIQQMDFKEAATSKTHIIQGFLNSDPLRTVRVRLKGEQGFLTIKGKSSEDGLTRFEWETKLTKEAAEKLLPLCEEGMIEKYRYEIPLGNHVWEVDEFLGENEGLYLAEIELSHSEESFPKPKWLGEEVTGNIAYYNAQLSKHPFKNW